MTPREQLIERRAQLHYQIALAEVQLRPIRMKVERWRAELREIEAVFEESMREEA
jgi:hypothetical protein